MPDSIFARSRISLISASRSAPEEWMVRGELDLLRRQVAARRCRRAGCDRISRLLSGVRSSCDMLARNSDLYCEVSASCSAFSSSAARQLDLAVLELDLGASARRAGAPSPPAARWSCCSSSCCSSGAPRTSAALSACCSRRSLVFCSSSCWLCSSAVSDCDCLQQVLGPHVRRDGVQHDADRLGELVEEGLVDRR